MKRPNTPDRNRTCDLAFRKRSLYPLSYGGLDVIIASREIDGMTPTLAIVFVTLVAPPATPVGPWAVSTVEGTTPAATLPEIDFTTHVAMARVDRPRPAWPTDPHVVLANGDRVAGPLVAADARSFTFENPILGKVSVPLTTVAAIWRTGPPAGTPADPMTASWLNGRKTDAVRLTNGDVIRGTVERFDDDRAVWLKPPGGPTRRIGPSQTVAVAFAAGLSRVRTPKDAHALVVLKDGSRITADTFLAKGNTLAFLGVAGFDAVVPQSAVDSITVLGGNATDLATLNPTTSRVEPFLGVSWPVATNRSAKGRPLRVESAKGVSTYDRGLGTHAKTTLAYDLAGQYGRFTAVVGLDAETGRGGRVPVKILVDGKDRTPEALKLLTLESGPVDVSLDVAGAKTLTLVVDFGPAGDANADVNWCEARLIRKK